MRYELHIRKIRQRGCNKWEQTKRWICSASVWNGSSNYNWTIQRRKQGHPLPLIEEVSRDLGSNLLFFSPTSHTGDCHCISSLSNRKRYLEELILGISQGRWALSHMTGGRECKIELWRNNWLLLRKWGETCKKRWTCLGKIATKMVPGKKVSGWNTLLCNLVVCHVSSPKVVSSFIFWILILCPEYCAQSPLLLISAAINFA